MTILTEGSHRGGFIVSVASGDRSYEGIILLLGENLTAGTPVARITASGKYVEYDNAGADGSETAVGVLYDNVDATAADKTAVIIARDAEVNLGELNWFTGASQAAIDAGVADLLVQGIVAR